MAGTVPTLYWFDRWDERIGLLRVVGELVHTEELLELGHSERGLNARAFSLKTCQRARFLYARSGEDTLEFQSYEVPTKGDRLLWRDGETWREHVVVRTDEPLEGLCSVYAESSLSELLDDFIEEQHLVSLLEQGVYTALYGFGAGLPFTDEEGNYKAGYRRKLTFGDINGGLNYVADENAKQVWGRWNADRTAKVHSFGQVTFSEETEPARLLALTRKALAEAVKPKVSYEVDELADLDF